MGTTYQVEVPKKNREIISRERSRNTKRKGEVEKGGVRSLSFQRRVF